MFGYQIPQLHPAPSDNQETHEEWFARLRLNNAHSLKLGIEYGWWDSVEGGAPVKHIEVKVADNETFASAFARAGIFPSVGTAKKAGWSQTAVAGFYKIGKRTVKVITT
jgi:hypothetical protein